MIWTISPSYLNDKLLKKLWKDALIVQKLLKSSSRKKYLELFRNCRYPLLAIGHYLTEIYNEASFRGILLNSSKISHFDYADPNIIPLSDSQLRYEFCLLQRHLATHDKVQWLKNCQVFERDLTIHENSLFLKTRETDYAAK